VSRRSASSPRACARPLAAPTSPQRGSLDYRPSPSGDGLFLVREKLVGGRPEGGPTDCQLEAERRPICACHRDRRSSRLKRVLRRSATACQRVVVRAGRLRLPSLRHEQVVEPAYCTSPCVRSNRFIMLSTSTVNSGRNGQTGTSTAARKSSCARTASGRVAPTRSCPETVPCSRPLRGSSPDPDRSPLLTDLASRAGIQQVVVRHAVAVRVAAEVVGVRPSRLPL
jgi:hypothetical protein